MLFFNLKDLQQVTSLLLQNVLFMDEIKEFQIVWIYRIHSYLPVHLNFLSSLLCLTNPLLHLNLAPP